MFNSNKSPEKSKKNWLSSFFKKDKNDEYSLVQQQDITVNTEKPIIKKPTQLSNLVSGLKKTKTRLLEGISLVFSEKKQIDSEALEELESHLIASDFGVATTQNIMNRLKKQLSRHAVNDMEMLISELKKELTAILNTDNQKTNQLNTTDTPSVILIVGVNGVGKTTTIGKLAYYFKLQKKSILLAAGDTFRAAAVEQLKIWGERMSVPVIAQQQGSDSAAVLYDAYESARAKKIDIVLADTAGRLHNKDNLMHELKKIKKVLNRLNPNSPHEIILVVDAGIGQNTIRQAISFHETIGLTGLILTKLDGTAKGGVIFDLAETMQLPIYFLGIGEQISDLKPFNTEEFIDTLFEDSTLCSNAALDFNQKS
ncbi:MAG: signal recognition particle-docking protein FtsY [Endozoicomonadaceae bacterium]|nr:signal recognition particle-docking protein FtsY [Endozoicomonadaceae bacterium]